MIRLIQRHGVSDRQWFGIVEEFCHQQKQKMIPGIGSSLVGRLMTLSSCKISTFSQYFLSAQYFMCIFRNYWITIFQVLITRQSLYNTQCSPTATMIELKRFQSGKSMCIHVWKKLNAKRRFWTLRNLFRTFLQ